MKKSYIQETKVAHKDIPQEAEPQSHRESLGGIGMDLMYVTRQVTVIEPGHFSAKKM